MKKSEYIIGKGPAPEWCRGLLSPYQKMNGSVGYEFHGADRDFELNIGDKLVYDNGRILIGREAAQ